MANQKGTPDNQANAINGTPETQTKPTKNQLGELKDSVKKGVLPLITGAILAHGVSATDLKANPIDVQDKPGITQVVDSSKQERNQLKTELEDKVTEKEMFDAILKKRNGQSYIDMYHSLNSELQSRVISMYNEYKTHPKQIKLVGLYIKILSNIDKSAKFVMEYDQNKMYTDFPDTIGDEFDTLLGIELNITKYFDISGENNLYSVKNMQSLDRIVDLLRKTNEAKINSYLANAKGDLANAKGDLANAKGDLANAKGDLVGAQQKLKNTQEIGKELEDLLIYLRKLNGKS